MTTDALSEGQFLHYTNHRFSPGDEVVPPAVHGLLSQHADNPHYRSDRVFIAHPDARYDTGFHHYGAHAYVVEPHGPVEPDPEGVHLDKHYEQHGLEPDSIERERARQQYMTTGARVVAHYATDDVFGGQGSGAHRP